MADKISKSFSKKDLVKALVSEPIRWAIEMRLVKSLLKKNGDINFWFFLSKYYKFNSIMGLLSKPNIILKTELEYKKQNFLKLVKKDPIELKADKIGEDVLDSKEKQTLVNFINS